MLANKYQGIAMRAKFLTMTIPGSHSKQQVTDAFRIAQDKDHDTNRADWTGGCILVERSLQLCQLASAANFGKRKSPWREGYREAPVRALTIQSYRQSAR